MEGSSRRRRRRRRRIVVGSALVVVGLAVAWTVSQLWLVGRDFRAARDAAGDVGRALKSRDGQGAREAGERMRTSADAAAARTDGWWWSALTHAPGIGDDVSGLRAVSASLDVIAADAVDPMTVAALRADHVTVGGRVDVDLARRLQPQVASAANAVARGHDLLADVEADGLSEVWRQDYESYAGLVARLDDALGAADTALEVLPGMVGADGPRDWLLVFQNNAEVRAGGGVPGSWAHVHAEDGLLTMGEQGSAAEFGERRTPVLPLTREERKVYGAPLGTYFQDATFTPDFPRAADLMRARWEESHPGTHLDGVISVDTVALSYALEGIGPVRAGDATLTAGNVVDVLLRDVYAALPVDQQDGAFQLAAKAVFDASQGDLASVPDFLAGVHRAVEEDRVRLATFHADEAEVLAGSQVLGEAPVDDDSPQVAVTIDDATGSKMSYYLRRSVDLEATDCTDGVQALRGRVLLSQTIDPAAARALPDYVTGGGRYGTAPGQHLVVLRIHAPYDGSVEWAEIDGDRLDPSVATLDRRPVLSIPVLLSDKDVEVRWLVRSGADQNDDARLWVTPGVEQGSESETVATGC